MIKQLAILLVTACCCSSCALPGKDNLVEKGIVTKVSVPGKQKVIAQCVTDLLDNEKWGLWDIAAPVSRTTQSPDGSTTHLVSIANGGSPVMLWTADLTQATATDTSIELITRRDFHPSLSAHYLLDKLQAAIGQCGRSKNSQAHP